MVNPVHGRRHNRETESWLELARQSHVGMREQACAQCEGFGNEEPRGRDTQGPHAESFHPSRHDDFAEMEANAGRCIHVEIAVMGSMETPEERHAMIKAMDAIPHEIEYDDREKDVRDRREIQ